MSIRAAMENPEPVEPTMVSTPDGLYCLDHGVMDCTEPFCWKCGNHKMDDFERCADPKCRATNTAEARTRVEVIKSDWSAAGAVGPVPLEVIAYAIAVWYTVHPSPSLPESGRGASGNGPASGAGP